MISENLLDMVGKAKDFRRICARNPRMVKGGQEIDPQFNLFDHMAEIFPDHLSQ